MGMASGSAACSGFGLEVDIALADLGIEEQHIVELEQQLVCWRIPRVCMESPLIVQVVNLGRKRFTFILKESASIDTAGSSALGLHSTDRPCSFDPYRHSYLINLSLKNKK
mgnify:CR=1 FL=1